MRGTTNNNCTTNNNINFKIYKKHLCSISRKNTENIVVKLMLYLIAH